MGFPLAGLQRLCLVGSKLPERDDTQQHEIRDQERAMGGAP